MSGARSRSAAAAARVLLLALAVASGCSGADELVDDRCPPEGTTLGYESFGKPFFATWCNNCHGGIDSYSSRAFNTLEAIQAQRERIYVNSAGDNTAMPPGPDDPSEPARDQLAEWLSCGAPE